MMNIRIIDRYTPTLFRLFPEMRDIVLSFYTPSFTDVCIHSGKASDYNPKTIDEYLDVVETLEQRRIITYGKIQHSTSKIDLEELEERRKNDPGIWTKLWKRHRLYQSKPYLEYIEEKRKTSELTATAFL